MREIEVKILEIDEEKTRKMLDAFAGKISDRVLLTTITFSNPYNSATVRARIIGDKTIFTVKVPVPDKEFKVRDEYETMVSDFETLKKQLEVLGFKQLMLQEKMRTTYKYKNSEILIDEYPRTPPYMEIEGSKEEIIETIHKLGYSMADTTDISIYGLFERHGIDAGYLVF
ncbi:MAG: class IV adenylate cyclase [Desulfobacterales bacterium]|nr:class IV adenylate cyclase [Desulfobacterales bacterium]